MSRADARYRVQLIGRFDGRITGLSRYTRGLRDGLADAGVDVSLTFPMRPPLPGTVDRALKGMGIDVAAFVASYPLRASLGPADVYHLTDQMLATLLLFQRFPGPVVVTVMDIIPYLVQDVPGLNTFRHWPDARFYRLALAGLREADALSVISEYTRQTLIEVLGLDGEQIHVIYPPVDQRRFRPVSVSGHFLERYQLQRDVPYVLYVGSEDPRKNLPALVRAMAVVRRELPDVILLKVGEAIFSRQRRRLERLIETLELGDHVRLLGAVPDEDLPSFYSLAQLCVLPSLYEGFGLPMAEAMACGTPIVYARSGPLPEVAGSAGVSVDPRDPRSIADAIVGLLRDPPARERLARLGTVEARRFSWQETAARTKALYERLIHDRAGATRLR